MEILEKFQEFIQEEFSKNNPQKKYNDPVPIMNKNPQKTLEMMKTNPSILENKGNYNFNSSYEVMNKEAENISGEKQRNREDDRRKYVGNERIAADNGKKEKEPDGFQNIREMGGKNNEAFLKKNEKR